MRGSFVALGLVVFVYGCGSSDSGSGGGTPTPTYVGASGVSITRIAIYQGVERELMDQGAPAQSNVPLVAGRDAMVRVFYTTDGSYDGQAVTARLAVGDGDPIELTQPLGAASVQADLASTLDFDVPGDRIGDTLAYSVAILQQDDGKKADNPTAHYPVQGQDSVAVEGHANTLRIIVVPYRYDTDGSGRLPDTSPDQIAALRQRFLQLYPVSNVEMSVHDPVPWNQALANDGNGWQTLGINLYGIRNTEHIPDDVYLYGTFDPADSFTKYCGFGCLLGVTLLNNSPPDTGNVGLRLALGVGYKEYAADTATHETGHAHGREHANCGPGLDPTSIDPNFPYDKGGIGSWGYDPFGRALLDPAVYSDIMGYCDKKWISDYNYIALFKRTQNVNLPYITGPATTYDVVAVDAHGKVEWGPTVQRTAGFPGRATDVTVHAGPATSTVEASFFPYDHMRGGWLFVPRRDAAPTRVVADVGGLHIDASR